MTEETANELLWLYNLGWFNIMAIVAVYLVPAITATARRHNNGAAIFALNLLLGWTFIGWCIALVWSLTNNIKR